ncbi:hypothetical protein L3Q82_007970 [Scortum barcoo]|uniref:Uncharacterized protein n=1 Tax=Scortum barcoo TaxID=214431 RepID=A0ACB8WKI5_9TELE|nr:hypothetical protein L3Q82_007970 [Scortum barcoo]
MESTFALLLQYVPISWLIAWLTGTPQKNGAIIHFIILYLCLCHLLLNDKSDCPKSKAVLFLRHIRCLFMDQFFKHFLPLAVVCGATNIFAKTLGLHCCHHNTRKYDSGEYLNITGITRDQAGDYECSALNDIASPDTKTVKVTVNFAPSIHEMKSHGVGLGRTALLRCEAAAVPSPTFEWYKGEKRIIKGQGIDIKSLSSRSVLTVTNMTEDRYGNYTCVASNKLGTANASVPLIQKPDYEETEILQFVQQAAESQFMFLAVACWGGGIEAGAASTFGNDVQLCGQAGTAQSVGSGSEEDEEDDGHDERRPE